MLSLPRKVEVKGVTSFYLRYSVEPRATSSVQSILSSPNHPLRIATKRRYDLQDGDSLLWGSMITTKVASKAVVRSWCKARIRHTMIEALKSRGLDKSGKRLKNADNKLKPGLAGLRGSATFSLLDKIITIDRQQLQREVDLALDRMIQLQLQLRHP